MRSPSDLFDRILAVRPAQKGPDRNGNVLLWCVYHGDGQGEAPHAPNLSVHRERGFVCHACGAKGSLAKLARELGIPVSDDHGAAQRAYDYRDASGHLLFQVVRKRDRHGGKIFRQRRPDGNGGWLWSLKGVRRVLYRLPQLLAASPDEITFIVEGEKDADALADLSLIATTNSGGAGKWRSEYSQALADRDVVILPDNDPVGTAHAHAVAQSLHGVARSIKIVELPNLPQKGDVSDWLGAGGTREKLLDLAHATPTWNPDESSRNRCGKPTEPDSASAVDDRPRVDVTNEDLDELAPQAWDALLAANDPPKYFRHGGRLARLIETDDDLRIEIMSEPAVRSALGRCAVFVRSGQGGKASIVYAPRSLVQDLLVLPSEEVPRLDAVIHAPVLKPSGDILSSAGYDDEVRLYLDLRGLRVDAVSTAPSSTEVAEARRLILEDLLGDFPFVDTADRAASVALLLHPFVRTLVRGPSPLHLVEKPTPGSGASLLIEVIALIAQGRSAPVLAEAKDDDEQRKRLTAALQGGPAFLVIDNVRRTIDSGSLAAALTTNVWEDRILGRTEMLRVPVRCAWVASGNNPSVSSEISRRVAPIRLDARCDQPWTRTGWRHPDLRKWVRENRGKLVWAALTLARHWVASGRPAWKGVALGSFESWSETMGGILATAGIDGFLENLPRFYSRADEEGEVWRSFVHAWWDTFGSRAVSASQLLDLTIEAGVDLGDGKVRSQTTRLGKKLREARDRRFGTLVLERAGTSRGSTTWRLSETRSGPPTAESTPKTVETPDDVHHVHQRPSTQAVSASGVVDVKDVKDVLPIRARVCARARARDAGEKRPSRPSRPPPPPTPSTVVVEPGQGRDNGQPPLEVIE